MSEPSFLDWYPRGRLALLASTQSKELKSRVEFAESIASALLTFTKVKYELQTILNAWSFSDKNSDLPSFSLPASFHISPDLQDLSCSQVAEASRYFLSLTDYVCRFSGELFFHLIQRPIFQKALDENPALCSLSDFPDLTFDRAIYVIDLGESTNRLMIEESFPPAQLDLSLEMQEYSEETIFINSIGVTSALIERNGKVEVFPVAAIYPFVLKLNEDNKNSINKFFQNNALILVLVLETETLIIKKLSDYFSADLDSSVHLLKSREAFCPVSVGGIDA